MRAITPFLSLSLPPGLLLCIGVLSCSSCAPRSALLIAPGLVSSCAGTQDQTRPLRVANYNIKSGMWSSLDEVAEVLEEIDADIVALEEVDHEMARTGSVDQSARLAERLGMTRVFAGALERDGGTYGVALLSKLPVLSAARFDLPLAGGFEPRVAIDAEVCAEGRALRVLAGHHDFTPWAAEAQARALAQHLDGARDVLVLGDFNITPDTDGMRALIRRPLVDALGLFTEGPTFEGVGRIDYILTDQRVAHAHIHPHTASDHFPVQALLEPLGAAALPSSQVARTP